MTYCVQELFSRGVASAKSSPCPRCGVGPCELGFAMDPPEGVDIEPPVCVSVPSVYLGRLCRLAREAGEDLQQHARDEYPDDGPTSTRRRNRDIDAAQQIIDAANKVQSMIGVYE